MDKGSVFKAIFYFLLAGLGIRRLRGQSFSVMLLAGPAVVADFGAHRGEVFAAVKAEYPVSWALLIEANPALADILKGRLGNEVDILRAALVGGNRKRPINFTLSANPRVIEHFQRESRSLRDRGSRRSSHNRLLSGASTVRRPRGFGEI
jgi:hypothetical protein